MKKIAYLLNIAIVAIAMGCNTETKSVHFEPTVESLQQYECPEWFRDAKFGIWSCWNAYTVPGQGDWYARHMYEEGSKAYNYHCKTYGHPSEFGYKDVVDLWKGENFNPKEQIKLFEEAGAKYFIAMANHHDNFDLWDSKYQPWNSVNYGPKRNIIGEWYEAMQESNMRWGLTSHLERTWSWLQVAKLADTNGEYKGIPYDGANPEYEQVYLPKEPTGDTSGSQPINTTPWWRKYWYNRCEDLIDKYHPDLFYVDGGVPFPGDDAGSTGLKMMAHLYNHNASRHGGQNEAVMCLKNWYHVAPKGEWGYYWDGIGTLDFERTRSSEILSEPWQTDTNMGAWTWLPNMKYRSAEDILCELVDVVSKNGNLLLNVSPRPDGTLDQEVVEILKSIGDWFDVNGESIYETRPWSVAGCDDWRVVKKGDKNNLLYLSSLKQLVGDEVVIPLFRSPKDAKIAKITELSTGRELPFETTTEGLRISNIDNQKGAYVWVYKIEGKNLDSFDLKEFEVTAKGDVLQSLKIWRDASQIDATAANHKAIAYDKNAVKWAISDDNILLSYETEQPTQHPYKVQDLDFTVSGYSGFIITNGDLYFGKNNEWQRVDGAPRAMRISISESGSIAIVTTDNKLWSKSLNKSGNYIRTGNFELFDVACGEGDAIAYVDEVGRIRIMDGSNKIQNYTGTGVTRIDYTPKTGHIVAIYGGEAAIYKDGEWLFLGEKATDVVGGKSNDDEIIGFIKK